LMEVLQSKKIKVNYVFQKDRIKIGDSFSIEILWPTREFLNQKSSDTNDYSLTHLVTFGSFTGLFTREFPNENLIHFSAIPWVNFTSLSHARSYSFPDSCPKISFGKMMIADDGKRTMSMSVHAHHGLMDGFQVGQFIDCFQELMNQ